MSTDDYTRRDLLKTCAAGSGFVALGSLAGCSDNGGGGGGNGNGNNTGNNNGNGSYGGVVDVPTGADALIGVDFQSMVSDQNIRSVGNTFLGELSAQQGYQGPSNVDDALDLGQTMGGLNPDDLYGMTMFTQTSGTAAAQQYSGAVMQTGWSESDMISAIESSGTTNLTESQYRGQTIYQSGSAMDTGMIGVLGNGNFVIGTEQAVKDQIDVSTGNAQAASGDLSTYFSETNDGHLRFASRIPEDQIPQDSGQVQGLQEVRYISGSFYSDGNNLGIDINMHTTTSSAATNLANSVDGLLSFASGSMVENPDAKEVLNQIEVSSSGQTATMSYVESVSTLNSYIETYVSQMAGMSAGNGMSNLEPAAA